MFSSSWRCFLVFVALIVWLTAATDTLPTLTQNQDLDGGLIAGVGVIAGFAALAMLLGACLFIIKLSRGPRWKVPLWEDEILNLQTQTI